MKQAQTLRRTLYTLKREYGFTLTLHKIESEALNYQTGARTPIIITQKINRAIILPAHLQRQFETDSQPVNFKYGALYDASLRKIIIDVRDLGDFNIEVDDYFIYNSKRYQVASAPEVICDIAVVILAKAVEGAVRHMVEEISFENNLILAQEVT